MSMNANVGCIAGSGSCVVPIYEVSSDIDDQQKMIYSRIRKLISNSGEDSLHELADLVEANKEKISKPYCHLINSIILLGEVIYKQIPEEFNQTDLQTTYFTLQYLLLKKLPE
ncbi:hypothetical protein [Waddlia chondrophila]|uniref:Uncharacterized protein n=2 Tax=Waddlia chondrophila TaxID=71667 RepID=D6YSQ2_WADCW|nr:hypothetical protein [Waddlia chondrophila]ADI39097.1 hypothetical protein wcw_1756 [Waddlia chondrophila WSU 86-1044]